MEHRTYKVFVGHAWAHSHDRGRLKSLLNGYRLFKWKDVSSPQYDPSLDTGSPEGKAALTGLLANCIAKADCVLILPGKNAAYPEWVQTEVNIAKKSGKPVILVMPRGAAQAPDFMREAAEEEVGWSAASIAAAIRNLAGGPVRKGE